MSNIQNWKVCLEIGLNHLGSYSKLEEIVIEIGLQKLGVAITVQIREESFYDSKKEIKEYLNQHKNQLQCVVGMEYIPFGVAQTPALNDYADGIDTLKWLNELK